MKYYKQPVIIIAAARSGTKMLREVLGRSDSLVEFPYDMNYIWLYGNYDKKHDELSKKDLTPKKQNYIRQRFEKLLNNSSADRVLEKSVPNCLRVEFVRNVFPEAQFIHLYRNGIDVSVDAMQCWNSSMFSQRIQKKSDLFKKTLTFPYISAFPYLKDYLTNYLERLFSQKKTVQSWGPRYKGLINDVKKLSIIEVCGIQWSRSVRCTLEQLSPMRENHNFINVQYEKLVLNPPKELDRICNFINISDADTVINYGQKYIRPDFIDFHKNVLSKNDKDRLMPLIEPSLIELGYLGK